ncbi:hypothetical protein N5853_12195 [Bartonella sp. HY329]|uniref:hypothetical protein n=1 Tax=unclassified Bartonella TaxID=2645622 RepID=UPI0021C8CB94|nr:MULTISPECIES: hypothetical protein [unclassified Bartonella]UXM94837.1 hypothetical protein N5853_12195 [Bartonella sp. HY329]UXN09160.1 hypothetical protein N5852_12205 [Bartonella sp. HY328]
MAEIIAALEFGPGHVWLIFDEPIADDAVIHITRDSDSAGNLGPNGWQAQSFGIDPIQIDTMASGARVLLGPDVVDYVLDGEAVTVNAGKVAFFAFWPPVTPAPKKSRNSVIDGGKAKEKIEPVFAAEPVEPEPKLEPAPEIKAVQDTAPAVEPPRTAEFSHNENIKNAVNAALAGQNNFGSNVPKKKSMVMPFVIIGLIAWVAILVGGYFIYSSFFNQPTEQVAGGEPATPGASNEPQQPTPSEPTPAEPNPVEPTPPEPVVEQTQLQRDFALGPDGWSGLITAPDTDPQRLFDLGRSLRNDEGGNTDIGFEAIYRAGERGNRAALEWYAKANDPTSNATGNDRITPPNIRRAFESWTKLAEQDASMRENITRLCNNLREKRYSGTADERTTFQDYCQ